jgi:uncharacterized protein YjlB
VDVRRGSLDDGSGAPAVGEHHDVVADLGAARIEQILSGVLEGPQRFVGAADEWFVVLGGSARLEIDDAVHALGAGDWMLIPAGVPHVLHETSPGTVWLAVHGAAGGDGTAGVPTA